MSIFDRMNSTELIAWAEFNDIRGANRGVPREDLIRAIKEHVDLAHDTELNKMRNEFAAWVREHWDSKLQMQVHCPGISKEGITCSDLQLVAYHLSNKEDIDLWKVTKRRV